MKKIKDDVKKIKIKSWIWKMNKKSNMYFYLIIIIFIFRILMWINHICLFHCICHYMINNVTLSVLMRVISFVSLSLIGHQENVSCVAIGGCGGCGRGQRSCQSVLGASELSGAQLWEQRDGNFILLWWFNAANIYVYIHHVVSLEATENVRLFFLSGSIITFACDALK